MAAARSLHVAVSLQESEDNSSRSYTQYDTTVTVKPDAASSVDSASSWVIPRRYKEFHAAKTELVAAFPEAADKADLFPPKVLLNNRAPDVISHRMQQIPKFFNAVARIPEVTAHASFRSLMELHRTPDSIVAAAEHGTQATQAPTTAEAQPQSVTASPEFKGHPLLSQASPPAGQAPADQAPAQSAAAAGDASELAEAAAAEKAEAERVAAEKAAAEKAEAERVAAEKAAAEKAEAERVAAEKAAAEKAEAERVAAEEAAAEKDDGGETPAGDEGDEDGDDGDGDEDGEDDEGEDGADDDVEADADEGKAEADSRAGTAAQAESNTKASGEAGAEGKSSTADAAVASQQDTQAAQAKPKSGKRKKRRKGRRCVHRRMAK